VKIIFFIALLSELAGKEPFTKVVVAASNEMADYMGDG
jgi:hypothetical protein